MSRESENKSIGSDLCNLSILLQNAGLCNDIGPLQSAGNSCISKANTTTWGYTLQKIVFIADEVGGRMASDSTDITVSLSIEIEGRTPDSLDIINPLSKLSFDIEIDGWRINEKMDVIENLYAAWHLDRHIFDQEDAKTKYSHPLYHFTFGGNKMENKGHDAYGTALILPSPRLCYPPMDAVLGIDFILQNYIHKDKIKKLIEDPKYTEILQNAQTRIWKPFFCSIYSHWNKESYTIDTDFAPVKLFPLYY
jgi:hypothetical protein